MVPGMTDATTDAFVRIGAAAAELGVNVDTLRAWCDAGKIPCWRTPSGERRIRRSVLDAIKPQPTEVAS
jgi:excisionase family DNA binding protein